MRLARVRNGEGLGGAFHCMSRIVEGRFIFDVRSGICPNSRKFVELMRKLAAFHEMTIITYSLMSNHVHILCREPLHRRASIEDSELIEKIKALNGSAAAVEFAWQLNHLRTELNAPEAAEELKARYLSRMGDVSSFMKELKGRFAQWYQLLFERLLWNTGGCGQGRYSLCSS